MSQVNYFPDWHEKILYNLNGPQPSILMADEKVKILMAGLEPGQKIPAHAEGASLYHFLAGSGRMSVDGQSYDVSSGTTLIMPAGSVRGLEAIERLAFLAVRIA
ncbi:MAG: cupin domain-containing protein [Candidatus Promineofilum sp.]|nr:cupin domain-containing protein [Promineifilum sp.]